MKALWIRVDAHLGQKAFIAVAAEALGVSDLEAIGLFVQFWGNVAYQTRRGDLTSAPNAALENWAGWRRKKGKFAAFVREHCVDVDGRVRDWDLYAGHLEDRRERDDSPDGKSTYVYYAVDGDACKIGWSGNPWSRIHEMRTARPGIKLAGVERGTRELERARQTQFEAIRIEREWFTLSDELAAHIRSLGVVVRSSDRSSDRSATVATTEPPTVAPAHTRAHANVTGRNGTERDGTEPPASASDIQNSNKRSGDLDAERSRERETASCAGPGSAPPAGARKLKPEDLPPDAIEFVVRHWPRIDGRPARRREVVEQLLATLGSGARYKKTWVRAGSPERLAAKCRLVMAEPMRDPDKAIVVLLAKLADTSDVSAVAVDRARAEQATEERQTAAELARAEAWLTDRPDVESAIDASLEQQGFPAAIADSGDEDNAFAATCRLVMRRSAVLAAWRDAGAPELVGKR